jgi:lipopolysaccharide transport system ATP-binding protein
MWAVRLDHVSKRYSRGGTAYPHLGSEMKLLVRRGLARLAGRSPGPQGTIALDDVSFEVEQGSSFGLVGPNGAGKSTILRMVSRITTPTGGQLRVRGRVGALIEVGSGVHPELTGRENIWLYGSILGISRQDIRRRFDEIVEFAQIEGAVDTQVKYYSSGMQLRLGFSVAAHLEPEVLVVDEALSVGDASFQARAVSRMRELVGGGTTVLLVSHDLWSIEALCPQAAFIDGGRLVEIGPTKGVLTRYLRDQEEQRALASGAGGVGKGVVNVLAATCHDASGRERYTFSPHESVEIRVRFAGPPGLPRPYVWLAVGQVDCSMLEGVAPAGDQDRLPAEWSCRLRIESLPLRPRLYEIWCSVIASEGHGRLLKWFQIGSLRIESPVPEGRTAVANAFSPDMGSVLVDHTWTIIPEPGD